MTVSCRKMTLTGARRLLVHCSAKLLSIGRRSRTAIY